MKNKQIQNMEKYSWGPTDEFLISLLKKEILEDKMYTTIYDIQEGDIVVDIGASTGIFSYSILDKKPKHIFCFEPSKNEFPHLVKNTMGNPVTQINKAIGKIDGIDSGNLTVFFDEGEFETIKFSTFLKIYGIEKINFLKTDCEGGEYHIFTEENMDFLLNNVDHIVGEWHLGNAEEKKLFRHFRDNYINRFKKVEVFSVDGIDIKWDLWNDHFIEYYKQVIFHIKSK